MGLGQWERKECLGANERNKNWKRALLFHSNDYSGQINTQSKAIINYYYKKFSLAFTGIMIRKAGCKDWNWNNNFKCFTQKHLQKLLSICIWVHMSVLIWEQLGNQILTAQCDPNQKYVLLILMMSEKNEENKKCKWKLGKTHHGLCFLPEIFEYAISYRQWRKKENIRYKNLLFYNVLTLQHYIAIVQYVSIIFLSQGVRFYHTNSSLNGNLMDISFVLLMQYIVK